MAHLITADFNHEDIEDWFKIGQEASQKKLPQVIASSTLGGRTFDPATGGALVIDRQKQIDSKLPKYKRHAHFDPRKQYVQEYKDQEYQELLSQNADSEIGISGVDDELERLELDSTIQGSAVALPEDLIPEGATDVYKNYKFHHQYQQLPVLEARDQIVNTIESNQVTIIQGPTGSGKTTQLPQFILDYYASESRYCNIIVTQPRKIAAMSVAKRVCDERDWEVGSVCGYQIALDRCGGEDTRILYCTTGILKEKLIAKRNMHEFTHVILDEVHERDIESDFVLLLVKKLLRTNSRHVKVVVTSATFDTEVFAQYFALPVRDHLEPAPVIKVGTMHYHVSEFFADDLTSRLGEVPPLEECEPGIHSSMYDMVAKLIVEFDLLEQKEQGKDEKTGFAPVRGTVLVFLPGFYEIQCMLERLMEMKTAYFYKLIPLHSSITLEEQKSAFVKAQPGYRKIIVSTNIAESSITVPDIKYVVDFCLTKNLCCDPDTNFTQLQLEWASKANTRQRKGRAGRVSNGRVYYMVPKWFYETVLSDFSTPEMQRSPLESVILKTKVFGMGEPKALLALALSPPNLDNIERTILSLKEIGALSTSVGENSNPYDGDLTFIGTVLAGLPVDVRIGKMLILGHVFGVLDECIILGAALSNKSIFSSRMEFRMQAYKGKLAWAAGSLSDCIAMINAYTTWESRTRTKLFQTTGQGEEAWAKMTHIQLKAMKEVHKQVQDLTKRLMDFNIVKPQRSGRDNNQDNKVFNRLVLKIVLSGAFYPNFAVKEPTDEAEAVKLLSSNDPSTTVMVKGLPIDQGVLYEKQIRQIFSACWNDPPPRISFEQSRAFISFPWHKGTIAEGKIHPAVLTALKMRQVGVKMPIELYDKEEAKRQLDILHKTASNVRSAGDLRTTRLKTDSLKPDGGTVKIDPHITTLKVNITEVIECSHFWGQCEDLPTSQLLSAIQTKLNAPRVQLQPFLQHPSQGMLVAAPYQDTRELYYRARIEHIDPKQVVGRGGTVTRLVMATVFFVDFGNTEKVHVDKLRVLPPGCKDKPFVALEFYLRGIKPSYLRSPDGKWVGRATEVFKHMVLNKSLYAQVYSIVNDTVRVDLGVSFANGEEICFNDELVQQGWAERTEESIVSQHDHEWRERAQHGDGSVRSPDSWLQVSLPASGDFRAGGGKRRGKRTYLSGPTNPLEMSFTSITLSGRQMVVRIEPDSVNSVAVDDDPQNKFSRLLVASDISLNPAGNSMIARNTTVMPQIPGLPALVTLLFAPYAEYRTDPKRERYIGAICGLGYDDEDMPILPDHDIELSFETKFETEDIAMINEVRLTINIALGTDSRMASWGEDITADLQHKARQCLKRLLQKPREYIDSEIYRKLYQWNQVDTQHVLCHSLCDTSADSNHLLRLHNAIALADTSEYRSLDPSDHERHNTQYYLRHLEQLKQHVSRGRRNPITCELCNVTLATPQYLAIHLQTEKHLNRVDRVHQGTYGV